MDLPVNYLKCSAAKRREVREEYIRLQDGNCMFCEKLLSDAPVMNRAINWKLFPKNFMKYPVHLQHDHKTDMTEGAVHAYCNAVLWQYYGR